MNLAVDADLRDRAKKLIDKRGLRGAAADIGVSSDSLARFVAGASSHPGTVKSIADGLRQARAMRR